MYGFTNEPCIYDDLTELFRYLVETIYFEERRPLKTVNYNTYDYVTPHLFHEGPTVNRDILLSFTVFTTRTTLIMKTLPLSTVYNFNSINTCPILNPGLIDYLSDHLSHITFIKICEQNLTNKIHSISDKNSFFII